MILRLFPTIVFLMLAWLAPNVLAASLEELIMPGPVTEAHADLEGDCDNCHSAFSGDDKQNELCLDCHEEVAFDLSNLDGFHGQSPDVAQSDCRDCHTDHEGREFDISGLVPETFAHQHTDFPLVGVHENLSCVSCHAESESFRGTNSTCVGCHEEDDHHAGGLGQECESCHSSESWAETSFDHDTETQFTLAGAHKEATCSQCHIDNQFENTSQECVDCHAVDDVHLGSRGTECAQCHTTSSWQESEFDHEAETGFVLSGAHFELSCSQCHQENMATPNPPTDCVGCHSSDDPHQGNRGGECDSCHTTKTWSIEFDHKAETGFALLGRHSELQCESCHTGALSDPISSSCESCHEADDPHAGTLGNCNECHSSVSWFSEIKFDHEFTQFPLIGLHSAVSCEQCHISQQFDQAESECVECHQQDDAHDGRFGQSCQQCHTPGGWKIWRFDHDRETAFPLEGSHTGLVCDACHGEDSGPAGYLDTDCVACHLADDAHGGQFGRDCGRCHTTESFQDTDGFN